MTYLTDEQIEAKALDLRRAMGLPLDRPLTLKDLEVGLARAFPDVRLVVLPDEEMTYAPAEADSFQRKLKIRQTAYDQMRNGSAWGLETFAHELGHFQLEHHGIRYRRGGRNHSRKTGNDEPQAHLFAYTESH